MLTLAYMNAGSLAITMAEGGPASGARAAGSCGAGETSGNIQRWCPSPPTATPTPWWWRWSGRACLPHRGGERFFQPVYVSDEVKPFLLRGALPAHRRTEEPAEGAATPPTSLTRDWTRS